MACGSALALGDRFRPVQKLGEGGFGRTFLALDTAADPPSRCVIKQSLRADVDAERFFQEADRLAELGQHPQIPALIAVLDSATGLCLVQSYVPGRNLAQIVLEVGVFQEEAVRSLLLSLLPVLQFIHDRQVIHRDIKPANILLGADNVPVLVDFGAAKAIRSTTQLERTGTVIGSAGYAAPEQALGKAVFASDLYSLGVTCLHLLTGQHPFDLYSVTADRWVWQPYVASPVSLGLAQILDRMAARSLRSRYPNAAAALADLQPGGALVSSPTVAIAKPSSTALTQPEGDLWKCSRLFPTGGLTVNALVISPDGRAIATANSNGTAQLWDWQSGDVIHTLGKRLGLFGDGHTDAVTAVQFSPDGRTLFTAGKDSRLHQWDLITYRLIQPGRRPGWVLTDLALSAATDQLIGATAEGKICLWRLADLTLQVTLVRHQNAVNALAVSADGLRLASAGEDGTLRLWALPSGQLLHTWTAGEPLLAIAFHPQQPIVITGSRQGKVEIWSLHQLDRHYPLEQREDAVTAIALSPHGLLATGSADGTIHLWDGARPPQRRIARLKHDWTVCDLTFTADGQHLISSAADGTIRVWQAVPE